MSFSLFKNKEAAKVIKNNKIEIKIISNEVSILNLIIFLTNRGEKNVRKKTIKKENKAAFLKNSSNKVINDTKENASNGTTKKKFRIRRGEI